MIVLSVTSGGVSIWWCVLYNSYWSTYRNNKCKSQSCIFTVYRTSKKILKATRNKKKKKNKSFVLEKNTESIDPKVSATSNGRTMILSKLAICGSKKSKFIKKQEAKGSLSNLQSFS